MTKGTQAPVVEPKAKINNDELITRFRAEGGNIVHIRPDQHSYTTRKRGLTVAYKVKSGRIEFSTAVQHRHDTFTKRIGTKTAIEHFDAGHVVAIPFDSVREDTYGGAAAFLRIRLG